MIGWTIGGMVHWKSSARKVTHQCINLGSSHGIQCHGENWASWSKPMLGDFWNPSVSKSNQLHVVIFRFFFINVKVYSIDYSIYIVMFLES